MVKFIFLTALFSLSLSAQADNKRPFRCGVRVMQEDGTTLLKYGAINQSYVKAIFKSKSRCEAKETEAFCQENIKCRRMW